MHVILIKRKKRNKKYSIFNFSEHLQHYEIGKFNESNITSCLLNLNANWNEASKLWNVRFYLTQNPKIYKFQEFSEIKHVHSSASNLFKKWYSSFPQRAAVTNLIQHCSDMTFFRETAELGRIFLSLLNIINLFDISFLAKSKFLYH